MGGPTTTPLHPAAVLDGLAAGCREGSANRTSHAVNADALRSYEQQQGVTFIAVPTLSLIAARKAYGLLTGGGSVNRDLVLSDLLAALPALLGPTA